MSGASTRYPGLQAHVLGRYIHLRRYGKKPGAVEVPTVDVMGDGQVVCRGHIYDLRCGDKGAKHAGFGHHPDGRYLQWNLADSTLEIRHPDGRVVHVQTYGGKPVAIVGDYLVYNDDPSQPWLVIDTATGARVGHVEDQRGDATHGSVQYTPEWFDPQNGRTLWLCEGSRLAELDVAQRRMTRTIEADPDHVFVGVAALADGHVVTLARTLEGQAAASQAGDCIVLFSPAGERLREVLGEVRCLHRLGEHFIVCDEYTMQFVLFDGTLEAVASVPVHEPGREGPRAIVPLPSAREWIAIGARGEWDHYGDPTLAPTSKARRPAAKRAAKK